MDPVHPAQARVVFPRDRRRARGNVSVRCERGLCVLAMSVALLHLQGCIGWNEQGREHVVLAGQGIPERLHAGASLEALERIYPDLIDQGHEEYVLPSESVHFSTDGKARVLGLYVCIVPHDEPSHRCQGWSGRIRYRGETRPLDSRTTRSEITQLLGNPTHTNDYRNTAIEERPSMMKSHVRWYKTGQSFAEIHSREAMTLRYPQHGLTFSFNDRLESIVIGREVP